MEKINNQIEENNPFTLQSYSLPLRKSLYWTSIIKALRPSHWSKNLLIFIPLLCAHEILNLNKFFNVSLSFFSFCFCSSGIYIINDLFDLRFDRQHPQKKMRPFASGHLSVKVGLILASILIFSGLSLSFYISNKFAIIASIYTIMSTSYSIILKRLVLIDVLTLALLYTLRIIAGYFSAHIRFSTWLLEFSMFFFLGLAFLKRFVELKNSPQFEKLLGRNYRIDDTNLIAGLGIATSSISILVFSLYVNSNEILQYHTFPQILWLTVLILTYWISHIWLNAFRGVFIDDPVAFAIKDRNSVICGILIIFTMFLAAFPI